MDNVLPESPQVNQVLTNQEEKTTVLTKHKHKLLKAPVILLFLILILLIPVSLFLLQKAKIITPGLNTQVKYALSESSPADQSTNVSVVAQPVFVFTKKLGVTEIELNKYFHINPYLHGTWHMEKNGQVVYFSLNNNSKDNFPNTFEFNTVYKILVDKSLPSIDKKQLENDINISFRTERNPKFGVYSRWKLFPTQANKEIKIEFNKIYASSRQYDLNGEYTVTVKDSNKEQVLQYFKSKNGHSLYELTPSSGDGRKVNASFISVGTGAIPTLILPQDTFTKNGIYLVTVKNAFGSDEFFVVCSDKVSQIINYKNEAYVLDTDINGNPLNAVTNEIYSLDNDVKLLDTISSNESGIAKYSGDSSKIDIVVSKNGNDTTFSYTNSQYYGYRNSTDDNLTVYSYSDKPVYKPKDVVHYKAVIRQMVGGAYQPVANQKFYISDLANTENKKDAYIEVQSDENGSVNADVALPKFIDSGVIGLYRKNNDKYISLDSYYLNIQSYNKPDMDISANSQEKEYISSDIAHYTVLAKTNYQTPLANVDFTYRVLLTSTDEVKDRTTQNIQSEVSSGYGSGDELVSGQGKFDGKGVAAITFPTNLPSSFEQSQIATLEITPSIGASPSIAKIARLIHRGEYAIFFDKINADTTSGISGSVVTLDQSTPRNPVLDKDITVSLYKIVAYNDKQLIENQTVNVGSSASAQFAFSTKDKGSYEIVAKGQDTKGNTITVRKQTFIGNNYYETLTQKNSILLNVNKSILKVGDTAEIEAKANFKMSSVYVAIATQDKIISFTKQDVNSENFTIPVLLKQEYGMSVGVSVYATNNGDAAWNQQTLLIDQDNKKIKTTISFDKATYKPGDNVTANITTLDQDGNPVSSDNSISVIDASILQIGELTGDIYNTFYDNPPYINFRQYDSTSGIYTDLEGGGGGCFTAGTKILLPGGLTKNIEDIKPGDRILTRESDYSSNLVEDTVIQTFQHAVTDYLTINDRLNVTYVHRIYLNGTWQEAGNAKVGDSLVDENGNTVKINSITWHNGQFMVYNLKTAKLHTFFADGIYVHNDKGLGPRQNFADTAYWNPHFKTDQSGKATLTFKLPDNLTTYSVQVVSNTTDSKFGQATSEIISHKDFNIIPVVSNFYYQEESPIVSALVQNESGSDADISVNLKINELGFTKNQNVSIKNGDFAYVNFPINNIRGNMLTINFTAKSNEGKQVDALLVKKQVLPRGRVNFSEKLLEGSGDVSLSSTYPNLDLNQVSIRITPNIMDQILNYSFYLPSSADTSSAWTLYIMSDVLKAAQDGYINPAAFKYAELKNRFRDAVNTLLSQKQGNVWPLPLYNPDYDTQATTNLFLAKALQEASMNGLLKEVSNIDGIIAEVKKNFVNPIQSGNSIQRREQLARLWVLNQQPIKGYDDDPEFIAIKALNGDYIALGKLLSKKLITSDDRYIWSGYDADTEFLATLAVVDKGSNSDATKAIKGASLVYGSYSGELGLLAGLKYAIKNNIGIDKTTVDVKVNGNEVKESDLNYPMSNFDGKLTLNVKVTGNTPVYTTIVQADYGVKPPFVSEAKNIDLNLERSYKEAATGVDVQSIKLGSSGIMVLKLPEFTNKYKFSPNSYDFTSSYIMEDAISSSFLYLPQAGYYGANYESVITKAFPGDNAYTGSAIIPIDYSEQAVFFNGKLNNFPYQLNFPYVVYNSTGGITYQPKTGIIFPNLGIYATEK